MKKLAVSTAFDSMITCTSGTHVIILQTLISSNMLLFDNNRLKKLSIHYMIISTSKDFISMPKSNLRIII